MKGYNMKQTQTNTVLDKSPDYIKKIDGTYSPVNLNLNIKISKELFEHYALGVLENKSYLEWFDKSLPKETAERVKEVLLTIKELEAITAKETIAATNMKEYVGNIDFNSSRYTESMEALSSQLEFKVTPKHLEQAANDVIQKSRFTGKKDGKRIINRKNLESFREGAGDYWKFFP